MTNKKKKILLALPFLLILCFVMSCGKPETSVTAQEEQVTKHFPLVAAEDTPFVELVSWNPHAECVILKSSCDMSLSNYAVRKAGTKSLVSLLDVELKAGVVKTVKLPKGFLNKGKNRLELVRLEKIDFKED